MLAKELMSHPAVTCGVDETLHEAAKAMWDHDCGAACVIDSSGTLVGIVTDRDIAMTAYVRELAPRAIPVKTAMAKHVITAGPGDSLGQIEALMANNRVRRIPIVDDANRPLGMISMTDLAVEAVQPRSRLVASQIAETIACVCLPRRSQPHIG